MARESSIQEFQRLTFYFQRLEDGQRGFLRQRHGEFSLKAYEFIYDEVRLKYSQILKVQRYLGDTILKETTKIFLDFIALLEEIEAMASEDFIARRNQLIDSLEEHYENLLSIWPQIAAIIRERTDIEEQERLTSSMLDEIKNVSPDIDIDAIKKQLDQDIQASKIAKEEIEEIKSYLSNELENFEARYKETFISEEFLVQQDIFKKEADKEGKIASKWLLGVISTTVLFIFLLTWILCHFKFDMTSNQINDLTAFNKVCANCGNQIMWFEIIKSIIFRFFLVGSSTYLLLFTIKNYNAHMHNKTVNRHKQNALAAALALLERSQTPEGKDHLIIHAAASIFTHQRTGYLVKDDPNGSILSVEKVLGKINPKS